MTSSVAKARPVPHIYIPVHQWRYKALIQSFVYARDPKSGLEYIFCSQARPAGRGDVQDTHYHRHLLTGDTAKYLDTMVVKRGGHAQNFHVRISAAGNPWIWGGIETYNSRGKRVGTRVARFRYHAGTAITPSHRDFRFISTGRGSAMPVSGRAGFVVLRRSFAITESYEECLEADLMAGKHKPVRKFTRLKVSRAIYQGSGSSAESVWMVSGKTDGVHKVRQYNWSARPAGVLDISRLMAPRGPNTSSEPEGVCMIRGVPHVGKRYNSVTKRLYILFALR